MDPIKCFIYPILASFLFTSILSFPNIRDLADNLPSSELLKSFAGHGNVRRPKLQEPPQYMLDLYNEIADDEGYAKSTLPFGATVVRALPERGVVKGNHIFFSLARIPEDEKVLEAQVHIHYHQIDNLQRVLLGDHTLFKFKLYAIDHDEEATLVSSQMVGGHFGGWRQFSVGESVIAARNAGTIQFRLDAVTVDEESIEVKIHQGNHNANKPLLVLFNEAASNQTSVQQEFPEFPEFSDQNEETSAPLKRVRRSASENTVVPLKKVPTAGCELRDLHIDFEKIGWSSWVVYPTGYNAYQCSGRCSFPLSQDLHPTNHATVVSIVNYSSKESDWVSHPCCVPTSYRSIALLYYDAEDTVILKHFDRMVATQCGCR